MDQYLNANDLSKRLSVSRGTVYSWVSRKKIPFEKFNGLVRFNEADIQHWHEQQEQERRRRNFKD